MFRLLFRVYSRLSLLGLLAGCPGGGGVHPVNLPESGAALFTWNSFYDTDIQVQDFFEDDHALMVRFMPQYERSYEGPLFTTIGGATDPGYTVSFVGEPVAGAGVQPHILIRLGAATAHYVVPHPVPATLTYGGQTRAQTPATAMWRQLFVVRRGPSLEVWLDGDHLCQKDPGTSCDLSIGTTAPRGHLRLGKRPIADPNAEMETQFYGFIDDLAVFDPALTEAELHGWFLTGAGISDAATGLRTGINFDRPRPDVHIRPPNTLTGTARIVEVGAQHLSGIDAPTLPIINGTEPLELPFAGGQTWQVRQEFATPYTHAGNAAFCWDFIYVPPGILPGVPKEDDITGIGPPFLSASDGTVEVVQQQFSAMAPGPANFIVIRRGLDELVTYAHQAQNSVRFAEGATVKRGERLALLSNVGGSNVHLHFGVLNRPETRNGEPFTQLVTRPAYFVDYCASDDFGRTWSVMRFGMPRLGQWVRRMPATGTCP